MLATYSRKDGWFKYRANTLTDSEISVVMLVSSEEWMLITDMLLETSMVFFLFKANNLQYVFQDSGFTEGSAGSSKQSGNKITFIT